MFDGQDVVVLGRQCLQYGIGVVGAAVVDEDDLVVHGQRGEDGGESLVHERNRLRVLVASDDGGEPRGPRVSHERPALTPSATPDPPGHSPPGASVALGVRAGRSWLTRGPRGS